MHGQTQGGESGEWKGLLHAVVGKKNEDMDEDMTPVYADVNKQAVLRDMKMFNDRVINPSQCAHILTRLLYLLLCQGETLNAEQAADVFFPTSKLLASPDQHLRRLVYLTLNEVNIGSDSSIMIVNPLIKDLSNKNPDLCRANSIRLLGHIMNADRIEEFERNLKQPIVDSNPYISATAITAAYKMYSAAPLIVNKWSVDIKSALNSHSPSVQYQALAMLYRIGSQGQVDIGRLCNSFVSDKTVPSLSNSPLAQSLLIRIMTAYLSAAGPNQFLIPNSLHERLLNYVFDCLQSGYSMVSYEAARSLCRLEGLPLVKLSAPVTVLQGLLSSESSPVHRFAAVKTLSELVVKHPSVVAPLATINGVNSYGPLGSLINDSNRTIATLAITTLLKTVVESNIDTLMKNISGFMAEIADEYKIILVDAIRVLCLKFPHKYPTLLNFLATALREEGGYKYKKSIVDSMLCIISEIKEATELGLEQFCEFIEDCEFPELSGRILHVLGDEGPSTLNPARYIRFIFNRVILETASVRCAAVTSLAKFGAACPALTENVIVLLKRCLTDSDDELRDRAVLYVSLLSSDRTRANQLLHLNSKQLPPLNQLEASVLNYVMQPSSEPFSINRHLVAVREEPDSTPKAREQTGSGFGSSSGSTAAAAAAPSAAPTNLVNPYIELIKNIPELSSLGTIFKSCAPIDLTESESEYMVSYIKHILPQHVLFQFNVTNNMEGQLLENVTVAMDGEDDSWERTVSIPSMEIPSGNTGVVFVAFSRPSDSFSSEAFSCTLHFSTRDVEDGEPIGNPIADEYQLEDVEVIESDFMKPGTNLGLVEFKRQWDGFGEAVEIVKKYSLELNSVQAAVKAVIDLLGMQPCESGGIVPDGATKHAVNLTGVFYGDINVLARAGFMMDAKHGVTLKIAVRSNNSRVNQMLTSAIR